MKDTIITPKLLIRWDACRDGEAWGLSVIGAGMKLAKLLHKFERADWMLWTLGKAEACTKVQYVEMAVICARTVLNIYETEYSKDKRPRLAIEAAVLYVKNPTEDNRNAAYAAAYAAAEAADATTYAAARAAEAAYAAACAAAEAAARAADVAAYAAARAADATTYAAARAAEAAAYAADVDATDAASRAAEAAGDAREKHHKKMCALLLKAIKGFKP
jgi:hypothetical protein